MPKLNYPNRQIQLIAKIIDKLTKDIRHVISQLLLNYWIPNAGRINIYIDFRMSKEPKQMLIDIGSPPTYGSNNSVLNG